MQRLVYAVAAVAALAVSVAVLSALGPRFGIGTDPTPPEGPTVDLGIFEPVAGRIVYGDGSGIWGVDPAAPPDPATRVQLTSEAVTPLGWSSDGTELLFVRNQAFLYILHADGSETQVTTDPMPSRIATISPDGSYVVFSAAEGLYAVDADGGPAKMLRTAHVADLTFSPDGTQIAYVDWGRGDSEHSVWLMDADGSNAHQIWPNDVTLGGGHVHGHALAWSPTGDGIALALEGTIYTFAPDGSDFIQIANGESPYWSPDGSQIAYTRSCINGRGEADPTRCRLVIADADGSNVRTFDFGASGPWHPGVQEMPLPTPTSEPSAFVIKSLKYAELHAPYREGWHQSSNMLSRGGVIGISAWSIDGVYADPCRWETSLVPLAFKGSWFEDFVQTLMEQPGRNASAVDTELDFGGWAVAATIELSVPADLDVETCDQGIYNAWTDISDQEPPSGDGNHEPGQTDIVYAVNIDRSPVIIHAWLRAGARAEDRAELEAMLAETRLDL